MFNLMTIKNVSFGRKKASISELIDVLSRDAINLNIFHGRIGRDNNEFSYF